MTALEEAFAKVVGRPPEEAERERLHRIRDALGVQDNDALWGIVMGLELYDSLYRQYPERLGEVTGKAIEQAREAFASAATVEAAKAQAALSRQVAQASVQLAKKMAERPVAAPWIAASMAGLVVFGAVCECAGAAVVGRQMPFWIGPTSGAWGAVLRAPAGWMVFALLLPLAAYAGRFGWTMVRESDGALGDQAVGWGIVAAAVVASLGGAFVLARVLA